MQTIFILKFQPEMQIKRFILQAIQHRMFADPYITDLPNLLRCLIQTA